MSKTWGFVFGGSGHGFESSCQIPAYYKFFPGFTVFCCISTGLKSQVVPFLDKQDYIAKLEKIVFDPILNKLDYIAKVEKLVSDKTAFMQVTKHENVFNPEKF